VHVQHAAASAGAGACARGARGPTICTGGSSGERTGPLSCNALEELDFDRIPEGVASWRDEEDARRRVAVDWTEDLPWARVTGLADDGSLEVEWTLGAQRIQVRGPVEGANARTFARMIAATSDIALLRICTGERCNLHVASARDQALSLFDRGARRPSRAALGGIVGFAMPGGGLAVQGDLVPTIALDRDGRVAVRVEPNGLCDECLAIFPQGLAQFRFSPTAVAEYGPDGAPPLYDFLDRASRDEAFTVRALMQDHEERALELNLARALHRGCTRASLDTMTAEVVLPRVWPRLAVAGTDHDRDNPGNRSRVRLLRDGSACFVSSWHIHNHLYSAVPIYLVARDDGTIRGIVADDARYIYVACRGAEE
jgi:hypothetical protein